MSCDTSRRSSESSLGRAIENTIRLALSTLTVPFLVITDLIIIGVLQFKPAGLFGHRSLERV